MNLPNKLTLTRIALVPVFILFYNYELYLYATIVFLIASFTDLLDGYFARKYNLITNFGKIMDPLADKILVYSAFSLMVEQHIVPAFILIIILAREFLVAGMRTVAAANGIVIAAGMSGKIKTVLQMIAVILLIFTSKPIVFEPIHTYLVYIGQVTLWLSLIMTIYSGIEYIWKNKQVFAA